PVGDKAKRRYSSLPDPDAIYEVIVSRPSGVVEMVAEYRFNPAAGSLSGYESRPIPGPFKGEALRLLPPEDVAGAGAQGINLETILTRTDKEPLATAVQAVTTRRLFDAATVPLGTFPSLKPSSLVLRLDVRPDP